MINFIMTRDSIEYVYVYPSPLSLFPFFSTMKYSVDIISDQVSCAIYMNTCIRTETVHCFQTVDKTWLLPSQDVKGLHLQCTPYSNGVIK